MIASKEGISDLIFTVGRPPLVDVHGELEEFPVQTPEPFFSSQEIKQLVDHLINGDERLKNDLATWGSCDCSYALKDRARFRVNIFKQNGEQAIVMRRLRSDIPTLDTLEMENEFAVDVARTAQPDVNPARRPT